MSFKDMFGEPFKGIHSYRIGPFAMVDFIGTILFGILISYWKNYSVKKTIMIIVGLMILAEIAHFIVGVDTAGALMIKDLFH